MEAIKPIFLVSINGKDVTSDLLNDCEEVSYTDKSAGSADEISITLNDQDNRWIGAWYPDKGSSIQVKLGYESDLLDCGYFESDEVTFSGPPTYCKIHGIAAALKKKLRTKNSAGFEKKTLKQIAESVAKKHGLTVQGITTDAIIDRITQNRETDLAFLTRVSSEYGYVFSIRGTKMIFTSAFDLEDRKESLTITPSDVSSYDFTDKGIDPVASATVKYHNPKTVKVVEAKVEAKSNVDKYTYNDIAGVDEKQIRVRATNEAQGKAKAKAALHKANSPQMECSVTMPGNTKVVAGNCVRIQGWGKMDGKWYIDESTHTVNKGSGYTTSFRGKKISK